MNFLDSIFWLIPLFAVVGPMLALVFGLLVYFKFPQFRLWVGAGLLIFGLWSLFAYLQPIIVVVSRGYCFVYPWYFYVVPFFGFASIFVGLFCFKNRMKGKQSKQI